MKSLIGRMICVLCLVAAGAYVGWEIKPTKIISDGPVQIWEPEAETVVIEQMKIDALKSDARRSIEERDATVAMLNRANKRIDELEAVVRSRTAERVAPTAAVADYYATLFVQKNCADLPNEAAAVRLFEAKTWATDFAAQTSFKVLKVGDAEAVPYYPFVRATPCLMLQYRNGQIIYCEVNADLAKCPRCLEHQIRSTLKRQRHGNENVCPGPNCNPQPKPEPKAPQSSEIIVKPPAAPPKEPENPIGKVIALGVLGLGTLGFKFFVASR